MKHKDYTKFSEPSKEIENETVTLTVDQDKHFDDVEGLEKAFQDTDTKPEDEIIEKDDVKLMGVVTGCTKLNVRSEASKDADVLCIINKGDEVEIDTEEENTYEDFYKIITTTGVKVKGYCMKDFISIK